MPTSRPSRGTECVCSSTRTIPTRASRGRRASPQLESAALAPRYGSSASTQTPPSAAPATAATACWSRRESGRTAGGTACSRIRTGTRSRWAWRFVRSAETRAAAPLAATADPHLRHFTIAVLLEEGRVLAAADVGRLGTVLQIAAPEIAVQARAGQFTSVRAGTAFDPPLRRPLSFNRIDRQSREIELIVKPAEPGGAGLAGRRPGARLDLLGPLGPSFVVHRSTRNLLPLAGGTRIARLPVPGAR